MLYVLKKVFSCRILQDTKFVCPFRENLPSTKVVVEQHLFTSVAFSRQLQRSAHSPGMHLILVGVRRSRVVMFTVHDVLAERLSRTYGIRSTALDWLRSYLCDRRQTILFDGVFSTVRSLSCGVPQGSVFGPLLFLLYTADLG